MNWSTIGIFHQLYQSKYCPLFENIEMSKSEGQTCKRFTSNKQFLVINKTKNSLPKRTERCFFPSLFWGEVILAGDHPSLSPSLSTPVIVTKWCISHNSPSSPTQHPLHHQPSPRLSGRSLTTQSPGTSPVRPLRLRLISWTSQTKAMPSKHSQSVFGFYS